MPLILSATPGPTVAAGICYGSTDIAAAPGFEAEAAALAARLAPADRIVSSPLRRCRRSPSSSAARLGAPLDPRRRAGARWTSAPGRAAPGTPSPRAELDAWAADFLHARPHGGESVAMLAARTAEALAACRAPAGAPLVVTHAGPIRAALGDWNRAIAYGEAIEL